MTSQSPDRPFLGILLMLGFCVLAPLGDATAKLLGDEMSVGFLVFIRFTVQAALLLPLVVLFGYPMPNGRRLLQLTALRTLLHIAGIGLMFSSLQYLPLADAIAIAFVMPFIMLLLGRVFLGEDIGPHRLIACAVGFCGTLLVVQPNFIDVGAPALLPLGVAVVFALFMLVTRKIAKDVDPIGLQALSGLMAAPLIGGALLLFPSLSLLETGAVSGTAWWLLLWLGVLGTLAHLLMTWSLRFAPSATLAPMQYLEIPIGTVIGYLVFRDLPNGLAAMGIGITIAAGLYIILRERAIARTLAKAPAP
ncbi:DMT family transporter [Octadecabacter sp. CECT 8868]|uniref:DMT family transporter n=1 Tax=Octadecabacter algicola TaxID=2909342 RepID=UPI001F262396|nr:DMT family transporter [Octadecabacter algicola]MCF2904421.1 DMT family transporter [Octadecabacter algicola]